MKFSFLWNNLEGVFRPFCTSDVVNDDGLSIVSCLLMDDGGLPYTDTISWIDEGLNRISSVLSGKESSVDWSRESWGASISIDSVTVYSLYDENYSQKLSINNFEKLLMAWRCFFNSEPDVEKTVDVLLSV